MPPHAHEARNVDGRLPSSVTIGHDISAAGARLFRTFPRIRHEKQDEIPVKESQKLISAPRMLDRLSTMEMPVVNNSQQALQQRSNTWSSSSENFGLEGDQDIIDDRKVYLDEYNRLSRKYGLRPLVPSDFPVTSTRTSSLPQRKGSWLSRALGANLTTASVAAGRMAEVPNHKIRHHRSVGDIVSNFVPSTKRPPSTTDDLSSLMRLSGKSLLYLPVDFATGPMVLPTCLRATAQMISQQAHTRGIFRTSGSLRIVNTLYQYYHESSNEEQVSSTIRCPSLPPHINFGIHDVATVFKRFLADLPGGILGSLSVFDALVAIYSQLEAEPELARTKKTRLRARLIALALSTIRSKYQRDLIRAVFGLLSFIGRQAEITSHEDLEGRPLPTTDLMGYNALGIVFGPLLIGELLTEYKMQVANPAGGLILFAITPPRSPKKTLAQNSVRSHQLAESLSSNVNKIHVANQIAEMLTTHWRDVIRQWRLLDTHFGQHYQQTPANILKPPTLRSSMTQPLAEPRDSMVDVPRTFSWQDRTGPDLSSFALRDDHVVESTNPTGFLRHKSSRTTPLSSSVDVPVTPYQPVWAVRRMLSPTLEKSAEASPTFSYRRGDSTPSPRNIGAGTLEYHTSIGTVPSLSDNTKTQILVPRGVDLASNIASQQSPADQMVEPAFGLRQKSPPVQSRNHSPHTDQYLHETRGPSDPRNPQTLARSTFQRESRGHRDRSKTEVSPKSQNRKGRTSPIRGLSMSASLEDKTARAASSFPPGKNGQSPHYFQQDELSTEKFENLKSRAPREHNNQTAEIDSPEYLGAARIGTTLHPKSCQSPHIGDEQDEIPGTGRATSFLARSSKSQIRISGEPSLQDIPRTSHDSEVKAPGTPPWKRLLLHRRSEQKRRPPALSTERKSIFESIPNSIPIMARTLSKQSAMSGGLARSMEDMKTADSPKTAWTPKSGGVKAMAALFDQQTGGPSQSQSVERPTGPSNTASRPSLSFITTSKNQKQESAPALPASAPSHAEPSKPELPSPLNGGRTAAPRTITPHSTPRAGSRHEVARLLAARTVPSDLFEGVSAPRPRLLSRPPSLGSMLHGDDEPPVAQHINFARPASIFGGGSPNGEDIGGNGGGVHRLLAASPRVASSTSLLHDRIRSLQSQLAMRDEELAQIRRQLETREDVDIGTLCEQLRQAKRECKLWRERAEAAERRVAAFEGLTARIRQLKDSNMPESTTQANAIDQHDGAVSSIREMIRPQGRHFISSSHQSEGTEDLESFQARIRSCILGGAKASVASEWDGEVFD